MGRWIAAARRFRWQQWLLVAALAAVVVVTAWQAAMAVRHMRALRMHPDQPIAEWMTVGHVARAYGVPAPVLLRSLDLPDARPERRPLGAIARDRGQSFEELRDDLLAAIEQSRQASGAPPGAGTATNGPP